MDLRPYRPSLVSKPGILDREDRKMDPKVTMEIPAQIRELAKKSVDQAENAISTFMQSASKSVAMVPGPMTEVAKNALAVTEASLRASFDHARRLMQAKEINEMMQLQSEFVKSQFEVATEQFKQVTSGMSSVARGTTTT
jgi:phasin